MRVFDAARQRLDYQWTCANPGRNRVAGDSRPMVMGQRFFKNREHRFTLHYTKQELANSVFVDFADAFRIHAHSVYFSSDNQLLARL